MSKRKIELLIALLLSLGLVALIAVAVQKNGSAEKVDENSSYEVSARFDNVGGLGIHSPVKASGVKIGKVVNIEYDTRGYEAVVTLSIDSRYDNFPVDTAASVLTKGLVGDQYVSLQPGAETTYLKDGSEIDITQSALVMEQIIGQFLYSMSKE